MRRGGRLALWTAVLLATLLLGVPAGAQSLSESGNPQATASRNEDSEATEPEAAEADPGDSAPGVQVVRYDGSDPYALSIELAEALAEARGDASEWVVLASGESWAEAAVAGPLAASLGAPVLLAPPGGLQSTTARSDLVAFLRSAGTRRAVIVGSPVVLPNHEPSLLFGLGMLPRNIERVYDDEPVGTSIAVAKRIGTPAKFGGLGRTVIIASDRSVADAVAVGPLAAAGPFPLLLTAPDALDPRITAYLAEHEVTHVVLAGGTTAVAPDVHEAIETAGITVTRLAGRDRDDTARLAADLFNLHTANDPKCGDGSIRAGLAPARHPEQARTAGSLLAQFCTSLRYSGPDRLPPDLHNTLYLASHRHEEVRVTAFADETQLPDGILEPTVPPALLAFPTTWPEDHPRHGQEAVAIVDELGRWRYYPVGPDRGSKQLYDYGDEVFEWSPDGRYLAYVDGPPLFVIDVLSDEVIEAKIEAPDLRFSGWHRPVWSPDSTKLAFSAFPCEDSTYVSWAEEDPYACTWYGTAEMYVFDTNTRETTRLTHNATSDEPWGWSPDSNSIAFTQAEVASGIFSIRPYWASLHVVDYATGSVTELFASANSHPNVTWAPDGSRVAFTGYSDESEYYEDSQVFVVRRDGSELEELTSGGRSGQIYGWDRDGYRLLYSIGYRFSDLEESEVFVRDVTTGVDSNLSFEQLMAGDLNGWSRFSDNLDNLVYHTPRRAPYGTILHVDVGTGESVQLLGAHLDATKVTALGHYPGERTISPDESQFAVIVDEERLVVVSNSWPDGQTIVDFSDEVILSRYGGCDGTWGDYGIRVNCETGRDF